MLELSKRILEDEKGEDVLSINLAGKSSMADHMLVASGRSARHVSAIAEKLVEAIKQAGLGVPSVEGKAQSDWVLVDAGDVIIHIFRPEVREFYQIEKIWSAEPAPKA